MTVFEWIDRVLLTAAVVMILLAGALLLVRLWRGPPCSTAPSAWMSPPP
ncbi:hypothetical protein ACFQVA_34155 [Actinomadura keratinilytica]